MKTNEVVSGRKPKTGNPKEGETRSSGQHVLRHLYEAKRDAQIAGVVRRQAERADRTPEQQLAILDERLGVDVGAMKERLRLDIAMRERALSETKDPKTIAYLQSLVRAKTIAYLQESLVRAKAGLEAAKMESRGFRIMRRLGLEERSVKDRLRMMFPHLDGERTIVVVNS